MTVPDNTDRSRALTSMELLADWAAGGTPDQWAPYDDYMEALRQLKEMMCHYRCAIMEVETKFKVLNTRFSLEKDRNPISNISSRLKAIESIYEKAQRNRIEPGIQSLKENIHDIAGVRVICSFVEDVYQLVDCLERQDDITILRCKDYIKNPKPNGYRSLHLVVEVPVFLPHSTRNVQVEVQLRTVAMEFWASLEHKLRYKKHMEPELLQAIAKELYECAQLSSRLDSRMQTVRYLIDGYSFLDEVDILDDSASES